VAQCKDSILAATGAQQLEHFPIPWHRKTSLDLCFIDFSSREPVSTSLENALERFPITWNHVIEKESLKFKELEHVLVEKVEQLFRDML
jgi:arsenate reductase-like glutaredoxin family protein